MIKVTGSSVTDGEVELIATAARFFLDRLLPAGQQKKLTLNNGDEYIRLTGMVRPQDISPDNVVASNRIADARIAYGGTGDFDQANQMGWLARFFNSEWFPL